MAGGPPREFRQDMNEFRPLAGEVIGVPSPIRVILHGHDDPAALEVGEALGEDAGGDALAGVHELAECVGVAEHDVAHDEERPAVADVVEGDAEWAPRAGFLSHGAKVARRALCARSFCCGRGRAGSGASGALARAGPAQRLAPLLGGPPSSLFRCLVIHKSSKKWLGKGMYLAGARCEKRAGRVRRLESAA